MPSIAVNALECSTSASPSASATPTASGPISDSRPRSSGALVQLQVVADLEAADHVEQGLERHALGIEEQLVSEIEDAQVAEHLALGSEECRVTAAPNRKRLDVVGHLPGEKGLRLRAGQGELAPLRAIHQATALGERPVLVVKGQIGAIGHGFELRGGAAGQRSASRAPLPFGHTSLGFTSMGLADGFSGDRRLAARGLDGSGARPADLR